jgi:hypothetical protein
LENFDGLGCNARQRQAAILKIDSLDHYTDPLVGPVTVSLERISSVPNDTKANQMQSSRMIRTSRVNRLSTRLALTLVASAITTGCYSFIPTANTGLASATPVTIRLTDAGSIAMRQSLGAGISDVEGTIRVSSPDSVVIDVENMYTSGHQKFASSGTSATIPRGYIDEVQVRAFSRRRTILMIAGGIATGVVAAVSVKAGGASASGGSSGGNPNASVGKP